ncbi:MAG: Gfo/Idh/MocA family oxidoreductase [Magnetococcales bacterium]|nr:Gfo/Idh/MocA family oxidoreductase [Magnetococcales bacterium]
MTRTSISQSRADDLPVAILGTSGFAATHVRALKKIPGVRIVGVYSRTLVRARQFADAHAIARATDQLEPLLDDPELRAVVIVTEPERHVELAWRALEANKDFLIEKPLGIDFGQAERLVAKAQAANRVGSVVSQLRFDPILQRMHHRVQALRTSQAPMLASVSVMMPRDQNYYAKGDGWRGVSGSVILNQAVHWVDLLNWFFGEPQRIHAVSTITRPFLHCPDQCAAVLHYPHPVTVTLISGTFSQGRFPPQLTIHHPEGCLDYQELRGPPPPKNWRERLGRKLAGQRVWGEVEVDAFERMMADFIDAVRMRHPPAVSLEDGLSALKVALAIQNARG